MIAEGETVVDRQVATKLGKALGADYCALQYDDHENVTLVLKYGEFNDETSADDMLDTIQNK